MVNLDSWGTSGPIGLILAPIIKFFNGLGVASQAFAVFLAVDFVIGTWAAYIRGEFKRSYMVTKFLTKLIVYLSVLVVSFYVSALSGASIMKTVSLGIILSKESLSILSHAIELGVFKKAELGWLQDIFERMGGKE